MIVVHDAGEAQHAEQMVEALAPLIEGLQIGHGPVNQLCPACRRRLTRTLVALSEGLLDALLRWEGEACPERRCPDLCTELQATSWHALPAVPDGECRGVSRALRLAA